MTGTPILVDTKRKIVPLASIDTSDRGCFIGLEIEPKSVLKSIKTVGLINPPLLATKSNGSYRVICGFSRVVACGMLAWENIPVRILKKKLSESALLRLSIWDNRSHRVLNVLEQSIAIGKLVRAGFPDSLERLSGTIGFPPNRKVFSKIRRLERLPSSVQKGLVAGVISFEAAVDLADLNTQEAQLLFNVLSPLRLSQNKETEVIMLAKEIGARENISITDLLSGDKVSQITEDCEANRNEKAKRLRLYLRKRRFPSLAQAEEHFKTLRKQLKLAGHIRLMPPPYFEGRFYTLQMSFRNLSEFKKRCKDIQTLSNKSALRELLDA